MQKLKLSRDLRKSVLRGHPWIYSDALLNPPRGGVPGLCELLDKRGEFLAWGMSCPNSDLRVRILSTNRKPPQVDFYEKRVLSAIQLRKQVVRGETNCYRLLNGEGDGLPGMVCDVYSDTAVVQFDGADCFAFWDHDWIAKVLLKHLPLRSVYVKPRFSDSWSPEVFGEIDSAQAVEVIENGIRFLVNYKEGQKTGFFLDQRDNRLYVRGLSRDQSVLNLFSYTGGFSLNAGIGGASRVTSVDLAPEAIRMAQESWQLNGLPGEKHQGVVADVFSYVEQATEKWDLVIVDPPSMTHSEKSKPMAMASYAELFAKAARLVVPGQHLLLSSCSSHISFEDFFSIVDEAMSRARLNAKIVRVSGQGPDHPFPHYCHELRYLKFVHLQI